MQKLRVGVVGAGLALEKLHYPAYQELADKYQIVALADVDIEKARSWAGRLGLNPEKDAYGDYREMMKRNDIDAFDIMVPITDNFEAADVVAKAGKPIILEKPLAPTPEQARACAELPKKYNIPVMIAENYRYSEEVNIIRDMIRTEKAGKPVYFMQNRVIFFPGDMKQQNKFPTVLWRQHAKFPGGAVLDTGVHDVAMLRHVFGAVEKLQAFGVPQNDEFAPYAVVNVNMKFMSGVTGQFSFYCAGQEMQRPLVGLRIFCANGMIYLEERDCGVINVSYSDGRSEQVPYRPRRGYYNELLNFYNAAVGREPLSVTPEMEYGDAMMIFRILESVGTGEVLGVDRDEGYMPSYMAEYQAHHTSGSREYL